jgi:hypothetical protein
MSESMSSGGGKPFDPGGLVRGGGTTSVSREGTLPLVGFLFSSFFESAHLPHHPPAHPGNPTPLPSLVPPAA